MSAMRICSVCSKPLAANAPQGLCPECLLKAALGTGADIGLDSQSQVESGKVPFVAPTPDELAKPFPQLEILGFIGQGGMGAVYKARQKALDRIVALKILPPGIGGDPSFAQRFAREAKALAKLNHPGIVTLYEFGQADGLFFFLMEFVDGMNLRHLLEVERISPREALAIVPQICDALQYAHDQGIVHRDIKPENILLDRQGRVKVADFGLAKLVGTEGEPSADGGAAAGSVVLTEAGKVMGTPQYMAPEQREHPTEVDHRADIYSLGVVFYQMLTGELPGKRIEPPSRKVQVDVRIDEIVLRALERTPELRYQTAADLRTQIETVVNGTGTASPANRTDNSAPRWLNVGTSLVTTPEQLGTFDGQFFLYRRKSQMLLEDRQLTFARGGTTTVIPLAAIRDLSIGHYPRTMHPAGLDFISVTYDEGGQTQRLFFSPYESWFGLPSHFNQFVAEWFNAIRVAVVAATGREPGNTPAEQLGVPSGSKAIYALLLGPAVLAGTFLLAGVLMGVRQFKGGAATHSLLGGPWVIILGMLAFGFLALAFGRLFGGGPKSRPGISPRQTSWLPRIVMVGRRGGKAVIHWPGVLLVFMLVLALAEAGAILASLLLEGRIGVRSVGIAFGSAVIFTGMLVRFGRTTSVEQLTNLDGPGGTGPKPEGEKAGGAWDICAPDAPRWAHALLAAAAVLIPLGAYVGRGLLQGAKPTQDIPSQFAGIVILLAVGALALFLAWQASRYLQTLLRLGRTTPVEQLRTLNGPEAEKPSKDTVSGEAGTAAASAVPHTVAQAGGKWQVAAIVVAALLLIPAVLLGVWFLTGRSEDSGSTPAPTSAFGPEITLVLGAVQGNTTDWLDLDTGRQMSLSFPDDEAAKLALFRTNGLDLMGIVTKDEIGVACREMVVRKVEGSRWDRASAQEIVSETASAPVGSGADDVAVITTSPRRKVTMFFRTREGGHGIFQIIGQSENPLGVKIRSKLVQTASGPNARALPGTPGSRSTPGSVAAKTQMAESQPKTATAMPKRVNHFTAITAGNGVTIACSPDGKLIAIANGNPTRIMLGNGASRVDGGWMPSADILNAETGKTVVSLKLTTADEDAVLAATERISHVEATALAFSPDGQLVAVGTSIGQVKLFNARTGELVRSLDDQQAKLADKKIPEKWKSLRRALGSVASLAFSPDGSLLATCGGSFGDYSRVFDSAERADEFSTGPGRLKVWEVRTGTLKHDLVGHSHANAVSFSPDGSLLASAGRWGERVVTGVIIWNPHTGTEIRAIPTEANGGTHAIAFSPDSKLVAISSLSFDKDKVKDASTGAVSVAHVATGIKEWQRTFPGLAKPVVFSPDGKSVAVLCGGRSIQLLETGTGTTKHEIRPADFSQGGRWNDFAIAPQGHMLAIGGVDNERKGSVETWDFHGLGTAANSAPLEDGDSMNNLKQIGLAMHSYHHVHKTFPAAYRAENSGRPLLSWRVLILPCLEQDALYREFHLDEPWDSEHNKKLIERMPPVYRSPGSKSAPATTNYLTVRGPNTVFPGKDGVGIQEITDGTSHTILVVEASDQKAVVWTKPDDFEYNEANPLAGLVGLRPAGFLAAFCDGSVRLIGPSVDKEALTRLILRNDGKPMPPKF